jgi:hypothetical protein
LLAAAIAPSYTAPDSQAFTRNLFVRSSPKTLILLTVSAVVLSACSRDGDIDSTGGISVTRSACPAIAVPAMTGDVTIFNPPSSRDARAIDVVANISNVRSTCDDTGQDVNVNVTFDVTARRADASAAREVVLPYFVTVVRGGRIVTSKSVSRVALRFNDGEVRAGTNGSGGAVISRAAATLPEEVRERITRKRKAGDEDAAIDPLADPTVREAVQRASFEVLVGFQLTSEQLQYNATR